MMQVKTWLTISALALLGLSANNQAFASEVMTPEKLWEVKRVSPLGLNQAKTHVIYKVTIPSVENNDFDNKVYQVSIADGSTQLLENYQGVVVDKNLSPDGSKRLLHETVTLEKVLASDIHDSLDAANAYVFDDLDYRHWDTWNDGSYNHVFYQDLKTENKIDIMADQPFNTPLKPFGGDEDYIWGPESENIYYVSKKLQGTAYVTSTNTDIYRYNLASKKTTNLTADNPGYDKSPAFSSTGQLAFLRMDTPGYEADKNDIMIMQGKEFINLTAHWNGTVGSFKWSLDGEKIYFVAPTQGTIQLFQVNLPVSSRNLPTVMQLTSGQYDVNGIVGEVDGQLIITRNSMNAAKEIYRFDLEDKQMTALTEVNTAMYADLDLPTVKKRMVTTQDGQEMLVWVIYPPGFDADKKYPTLLYAQGGPQSPLSQFYSFRWNFQLMASQGYIIVAPNRRGMPGHGVAWNEAISKDWGGGAMQDYLDAIDDVAKESYVDKDRLGAIGASFGGYSVFYLAGHHEKRFKTFISHDGVFDFRSMYGTTEELFFVNHDLGGPYWDQDNAAAQKGYAEFNPSNFVANWDTPMLVIHGGKDYRVPIGQGIQAFQAAKLLGLKSRLLYFPEENHWVLNPQNGIVWQREFFRWLEETL
ncbi:S9 family peptidase [Marinicella sp. S1101]|uniref:S9 family peptidase n=1 Tax=Marinicella marina TaxID=2996016 RepID=UPI002260C748|nr:S9 family peptidase [Marinicella marina]MCX7552513.1 S9 family peptidase [Marinicella marina]MDJ1139389.1 S9 family peptidase [Marinicella marina]